MIYGVDAENPASKVKQDVMISRFQDFQEEKCDSFIKQIVKYSCAGDNLESNFSKNDIISTANELAEKNIGNTSNKRSSPGYTEQNQFNTALGSISCEYGAAEPGNFPKNQLTLIDKELIPVAQSDLTAKNRKKLGLPLSPSAKDLLSDFTNANDKKSSYCESETLANKYNCDNFDGGEFCKKFDNSMKKDWDNYEEELIANSSISSNNEEVDQAVLDKAIAQQVEDIPSDHISTSVYQHQLTHMFEMMC